MQKKKCIFFLNSRILDFFPSRHLRATFSRLTWLVQMACLSVVLNSLIYSKVLLDLNKKIRNDFRTLLVWTSYAWFPWFRYNVNQKVEDYTKSSNWRRRYCTLDNPSPSHSSGCPSIPMSNERGRRFFATYLFFLFSNFMRWRKTTEIPRKKKKKKTFISGREKNSPRLLCVCACVCVGKNADAARLRT